MDTNNLISPQNQLPPHHLSKQVKIVLLILAVALLVVLGYVVWFQNHTPTDPGGDTITHPKKTTAPVTAAPPVSPTADWLTYTNTNFGFSFKYPKDYTVTDTLQTSGQGNGNQTVTIANAAATGHPSLSINVDPNGFDGAPTNLLYNLTVNNDGTLTIASSTKQAIDPAAPGVDPNRQVAGTNLGGMMIKTHTFIIRFSYDNGQDSLLTTFNELLGTFKAN